MRDGDLINTQVMTFTATLGEEDELRLRLARELMDQLGLLDEDGRPNPGVTHEVLRGANSHKPGYVVTIRRDMAKDTTPRLSGPGKGDA
jgi:hypothetical protein